MVGCVLSQLKHSELYILSCFTVKNVELRGFYPIPNVITGSGANKLTFCCRMLYSSC